ncbi:putative potassium channel regulatory protein unc-93 [Aphelenchoides bicaudatus]|nr:putative potassium channel regulatory protein unc-93 [Aphelenchoides bicaudatus]
MDGTNAWDLLDHDAKNDSQGSRSSSGSYSASEDEATVKAEVESKHDLKVKRRSKSPAVDSIRKVSRMFLEKVGIKKKKQPNYATLARTNDLPQFPFDLFCDYPKEFSYGYDKKTQKILEKRFVKNAKVTTSKATRKNSAEDHYAEAVWGTQYTPRLQTYDPYCPVHGSRRKLYRKRRRLLDMQSFVHSLDENDQTILNSDSYFAKALRKQQRAHAGTHIEKSKRKIQQNLIIISCGFLFLFIGFHGLQYLQTSVNGQVGSDALATYYFSLALSSLIVPPFVVSRLGSKLTLIAGFGVHLVYMLANFLPQYYSLIPASVLAGVAASCMWQANNVYINQSAINYSKLNIEAQGTVIVRFFGLFFLVVHCGQVVGSLVSSLILSLLIEIPKYDDQMDKTCGAGFPKNLSLLSPRAQLNLERPFQLAYSSVVAIDLVCVLVALMIIAFFLNALKRDEIRSKKPPKFTTDVLMLTLKNLKKPKVLLLIPLTVFNGVEQAFAIGIYTKAFVGCGLGISSIGFVMTSFGVSNAMFSLVFGPLIKLFGRMPLFVFGAVVNLLMILTLMIWPPNPADRAFFNIVASVLGMADSVWNTQIQGFWVGLTGRSSLEVAFANYRFWMSSGMAIGFFITRFITVKSYLAFSFVLLLIAIFCYFVTEIYNPVLTQLRKVAKNTEKDQSTNNNDKTSSARERESAERIRIEKV